MHTNNLLKPSKVFRLILFCTNPSFITNYFYAKPHKRWKNPVFLRKWKRKTLKIPIEKSTKNDHHKWPYYDHIHVLPTMFYHIILVSIWTYFMSFNAMLRASIIILSMTYASCLLCYPQFWILHYLLDNVMFNMSSLSVNMYDHIMSLCHKLLRRRKTLFSFVIMQPHHTMDNNKPSEMTSNNAMLCGMIYDSSVANATSTNTIFLVSFIILTIMQSFIWSTSKSYWL